MYNRVRTLLLAHLYNVDREYSADTDAIVEKIPFLVDVRASPRPTLVSLLACRSRCNPPAQAALEMAYKFNDILLPQINYLIDFNQLVSEGKGTVVHARSLTL